MRLAAKEKKERALGTKLFLKAFRSYSPKSAMVRRPTRPGMHGDKRVRGASEYKLQLMEKQKIKLTYGLSERQMKNIVGAAIAKRVTGGMSAADRIITALESRLDNIVYRLGISPSRIMARQAVSHGYITVNARKVTIPSYKVKKEDIITIKESYKHILLFKDLGNTLKTHVTLPWLTLDVATLQGTVTAQPHGVDVPFNINLVIDYYSR